MFWWVPTRAGSQIHLCLIRAPPSPRPGAGSTIYLCFVRGYPHVRAVQYTAACSQIYLSFFVGPHRGGQWNLPLLCAWVLTTASSKTYLCFVVSPQGRAVKSTFVLLCHQPDGNTILLSLVGCRGPEGRKCQSQGPQERRASTHRRGSTLSRGGSNFKCN